MRISAVRNAREVSEALSAIDTVHTNESVAPIGVLTATCVVSGMNELLQAAIASASGAI